MSKQINPCRTLVDNKYVLYLCPCFLAALCYLNGLTGQFVHDDVLAMKNNPDVNGQNPFWHLWKNDFWGTSMDSVSSHKSYRPLCVITFRLDYLLSGSSPIWFHVVNTCLHVCVTLTFTCVCLHALHTCHTCALLSSCLFAAHPIHTEAVTGLVGRADVMAGLCFLLSFYTYSRCVISSPTRDSPVADTKLHKRATVATGSLPAQMVWVSLSLGLSAAGMLCKETGLAVLGVSLLFDVLYNGREVVGDIKRGQFSVASFLFLLRVTCVVVVGAVLVVLRFWIMNFEQPQMFPEESNPASFSSSRLTRLLTFLYLPVFNFWLLLCPAQLSYDWSGLSIPLLTSVNDPRNLCSLAFYLTALLLLARATRKVWRRDKANDSILVMSVGFMVVPFLPASNLFFRVGFVVAERVLYIPSLGYCLLIAHSCVTISARVPVLKRELAFLYAVMLVVMVVRTIDRNQVWQSRDALFRSGVRTLPHNDKVHYNLANLLKDKGDRAGAGKYYNIAINLNPSIASYHLNLGTVLTDTTQALICYQEALRLRPQHTGALVNMGSLLLNQGNQSGMTLIKQALTIDPNHLEAVLTMAYVMMVSHNLPEADRYSTHALLIEPDSAKSHLCRGVYLQKMGQTETALAEYEAVLRLDPRDTHARLNSARIYFARGQLKVARTLLEKAVDLDQNCSDCFALLGSVYSRQGEGQDALVTLGHASSLAPNNTNTNLKYVQALKENHQSDKARTVLQELMLRLPDSLDVLKFAFMYAMEEGRYQEALQHIQEAISIVEQTRDSSLSSLYWDQGDAHRHNRDTASALKSFEKAIQLNSTFVEAIIDAGSIHFLQKNLVQAERYYLQALAIDRSNSLAQINLEKLRLVYPQTDRRRS